MNPTKPAERDERRRKVAHAMVAGATVNQMAEVLHVNRTTVLADMKVVRDDWKRERLGAFERLSAEVLVRLDKLHEAVWKDALSTTITFEQRIRAVAMALKITDQVSKLVGLYAPLRLDVRDDRMQSREDFDREVREHLARLDAADAGAVEAEARAILEGARSNGDHPNG